MKKTYCFSKVPIFQHLTEDEMKRVSSIITRYEYDTNDYIILAGSKDKKLFIVREGHAKASVISKDGKETVLRFLQSGDFFGDETLFQHNAISYTVEATQPTKICALDGNKLKELLAKSPLTLLKMMETVTARMDEVERRFVSICHDDVTTRLAHFLLERDPIITIAKKDLASVLGTSRETISRKLTEFQKDRSIVVKGRNIEIVNKEALGEKISG